MAKEDFVVLRAKEQIRDRLFELAKKRNQTLTAITDIALENFLDNNEFTFEDLIIAISKIPSLSPSVERIKNEMNGCPASICKQIMDIIDGKEVYLFEDNFETIADRVKKLDKENLVGIFVHITVKGNEINKVNETLKKIAEALENSKIRLSVGAKSNNHEKMLLFVAYNKKEEKDGAKK
jgi:hypothetical protein